jgi:hypothetical protein
MSSDEKAILDYLKPWPNVFISGREIAKRVGGKSRFAEDRFWAVPILTEMVRKGLLECDAMAAFRPIRQDRKKRGVNKKHVSPEILRILRTSGKKFDGVAVDQDTEGAEAPTPVEPSSSGSGT